ncbi:MAG: hypothetical protein AYL28_003930 [Candidatus Bathyarchaeota archaeon B23]|nr:MAG: hypothetical protein AYL28_003930 [Candidatus Bathyarchaeota archaeon B23]
MSMDTRASTPRDLKGYALSINGRAIAPDRLNELELREENRVVLKPPRGRRARASLHVDGVEVLDRSRPYDDSEAVEWRWRTSDPAGLHRVKLWIEDVGEYLFEIYGRRLRIGVEPYLEELREFSLNLIYDRYGLEIQGRLGGWYGYLSEHWARLKPVVERISKEPQRRLHRERVEKPIGEINKIDVDVVRSILARVAEGGVEGDESERLREILGKLVDRVEVEEERLDHNTAGNRLLRQHIDILLSKLRELIRTSEGLDEVLRRRLRGSEGDETVRLAREFLSNHELRTGVEALRRRIEGRLRDPRLSFLRELRGEVRPEELMELEANPHYADLHRIIRRYDEEAPDPLLRVKMPILKGEPAEIYKRWCAVKLLEAVLGLGYELGEEQVVALNSSSVEASLEMGRYSMLKGEGKRINLYYRRRYGVDESYGSYTSAKWVSLAVEAFADGDEKPRIIVLEPRFDLEYNEEKFERDVDALHILRDAVVDRSTGERLVVGGIILHPADLEPMRFRELSALPLRPGRVEGLTALLGELLG